jgi:hypothetical protein
MFWSAGKDVAASSIAFSAGEVAIPPSDYLKAFIGIASGASFPTMAFHMSSSLASCRKVVQEFLLALRMVRNQIFWALLNSQAEICRFLRFALAFPIKV